MEMVHIDHSGKKELSPTKRFGEDNAKKVLAYHSSFPEYREPPLTELNNFAEYWKLYCRKAWKRYLRASLRKACKSGGSQGIG